MIKTEFDKIVAEYKDKVYNTCLGFVKNREDAEDLAQEVFIEVFRNLNRFRGDAAMGTWLYRIAVNKSLEYIRKHQRLKRKGEVSGLSQLPEKEADVFYHPGVALENKERGAILFRVIGSLPEQQRVAFTLQKVEGLSIEEIGKVMLKSSASIESLIHRARQNLRTKLKDYYEKE